MPLAPSGTSKRAASGIIASGPFSRKSGNQPG
jgi:hypothetical protein